MSLGGTRKSALFWAASLVGLFAGVVAATDAIVPGDRETVLTARTRSAFQTDFRAGVTELPVVLAIANIGRTRCWSVASWDRALRTGCRGSPQAPGFAGSTQHIRWCRMEARRIAVRSLRAFHSRARLS